MYRLDIIIKHCWSSLFIYLFLFYFIRCHGPRPPPLPEFTLKPKKKKSTHQNEPTPGTSCPPCPELVWKSCVGNHIGAERMVSIKLPDLVKEKLLIFFLFLWKYLFCIAHYIWKFFKYSHQSFHCFNTFSFQMVCSNRAEFSCDNLCGNLLNCGNHYCTKVCHAIKLNHSSASEGHGRVEPCEKCTLRCQKVWSQICNPLFHSSVCHMLMPNVSHNMLEELCFNIRWLSLKKKKSFDDSLVTILHLGERANMSTSLSLAMSSWRMPSLQSTYKAGMPLWCNGSCIRVHLLQQFVSKRASVCSVM